jgi:DNA-binding response OmpR family regulator
VLSDLELEGFVARAQARLELYPAPARVLAALVSAAPRPVSLARIDELIEHRRHVRFRDSPRKRVQVQVSLLRTALCQSLGFKRHCIQFGEDGYQMTRHAATRAQRFVLEGEA